MWYCPSCSRANEESAGRCAGCGKPRPSSKPIPGLRSENKRRKGKIKKRRSLWWLWLLVVLLLLLAAAAAGYVFFHIWTPATCTQPEICRICQERRGQPLGHDAEEASCESASVCARCGEVLAPTLGHEATEASCEEPSRCRRCGIELAPALGHDWQAADYDRPETCRRCGETRGEVLGWIGDLDGSMGEETLMLYARSESHPFEMTRSVQRARSLAFHLKLTEVEGDPYGEWGIYGRDPEGQWQLLGSFGVTEAAFENYSHFFLTLDGQQSFDALTAVPLTEAAYKIRYTFYYDQVQENLG